MAVSRPACESFGPDDIDSGLFGLIDDSPADSPIAVSPELSHRQVGDRYRLGCAKWTGIRFPEQLESLGVYLVTGDFESVVNVKPADCGLHVLVKLLHIFRARGHTLEGEHRHRIVPMLLGELLPEPFSPVLVSCLIAVYQHVGERLPEIFPDMFLQRIQDIVPMESGQLGTHLVHLEALPDQLFRHRMRESHRAGMSDAENRPFSRWRDPSEGS